MSTGGIPTTNLDLPRLNFIPGEIRGTQAASAWLNGFSFVTPQAGGEKMEMEIRVLLLLLENI